MNTLTLLPIDREHATDEKSCVRRCTELANDADHFAALAVELGYPVKTVVANDNGGYEGEFANGLKFVSIWDPRGRREPSGYNIHISK